MCVCVCECVYVCLCVCPCALVRLCDVNVYTRAFALRNLLVGHLTT